MNNDFFREDNTVDFTTEELEVLNFVFCLLVDEDADEDDRKNLGDLINNLWVEGDTTRSLFNRAELALN